MPKFDYATGGHAKKRRAKLPKCMPRGKKKQQQQNTSCRNMENMKPRPKTVTKTAPFPSQNWKRKNARAGEICMHIYKLSQEKSSWWLYSSKKYKVKDITQKKLHLIIKFGCLASLK